MHNVSQHNVNQAYIDVRACWPTLILGVNAVELPHCKRGITVEEAVEFLTVPNTSAVKRSYEV